MLVWVVEITAWNGHAMLPFDVLSAGNGHELQCAAFTTRAEARAYRRRHSSTEWTRIRRYRLVPVREKKR